jgi:hypothetical protein
MSEPTAAVKSAAKAVQDGKLNADKLHDIANIVETAELAVEVPSRVVLSQTLVVTVGVLVGAAAGVGGTFLYKKLVERRQIKKDAQALAELEKVSHEA